MGRLDDKVGLIFGCSPNNGGTIGHFMAKEGAKIAACDQVGEVAEETAKFLKERGYDAIAIQASAVNETEVEEAVRKTVVHFGYLTTMVNMGGEGQFRGPVTEIKMEEWQKSLGTLTAGMVTTKYAARAMMEKEVRGSMIHLISTAGHYGEPGNSGYSASKAGLMNFSRAAAMDLAHLGIRVNTVTPYAMEHNLWRGRFAAGGEEPPRTRYSTTRDEILKMIPLGRFPRAADLAWAAVYLSSDEADFLTGVDIPVDGGTRVKYPSWIPGLFNGVNIDDYRKSLKITKYGEPVADFLQ